MINLITNQKHIVQYSSTIPLAADAKLTPLMNSAADSRYGGGESIPDLEWPAA